MNLLKSTFLTFLFFSLSLTLFSQDIPFPTEKNALTQLKSSKSLANKLKQEYGVNLMTDLTIERDDWVGVYGNGFSLKYSSEGQKYSWKNPEDMCYVIFNATTSKNADGVSYEIPIAIYYTRLTSEGGDTYIMNNWTYYRWELSSPTIYGAKKITPQLKYSVVSNALSDVFDSNFDSEKSNINFMLDGMEGCIKIDSIYPQSGREDFIVSPTKQKWELTLRGDFAINEEGAKMEQLGENLEVDVDVTVELVGEQWVAKEIYIRRMPYSGMDTYEGDELYNTYKDIGLDGIYKQRTVKAVPRNTETYLDIYAKMFKNTIANLSDNDETDLANLSFFVENGNKEITKSIRDFFVELKKKQIVLKNESYEKHSRYVDGKDVYYMEAKFELTRESATGNKGLTKQYLEAGMSKKVIKASKFYKRYSQDLNLVFRDNRWYITEKMTKDFEIPFN